MRTTVTIDDDVATLLRKEIRRTGEPMKQTINRIMRRGFAENPTHTKPRRFVVKPIDTGITPAQWAAWEGKKLEEILEEAERP